MNDPTATYVDEQAVRDHTEWATLTDLCVSDHITAAVELWAVPAGALWRVEDVTRNGWITLTKQTSTGMNCWDDVPGDVRKVRATNRTTVRRVLNLNPFHHNNNRKGW